MLKHILTGGHPSVAGSRYQQQHHHNDYQTTTGILPSPGDSQQQQHNATMQLDHHHHHHHHHFSRSRNPGTDVYDSVHRVAVPQFPQRATAATPSSVHRHPLNHSQSSVNNLSQRLNGTHHSQAFNLSLLSASKHSVNSVSPVVVDSNGKPLAHYPQHRPKANGGLDISRLDMSRLSRLPSQATPSPVQIPGTVVPGGTATVGATHGVVALNNSWSSSSLSRQQKLFVGSQEPGVKEMLASLALVCLVSLLLALLSLVFLLKISPLSRRPEDRVVQNSFVSSEEYMIVYEITLATCSISLSLALSASFVCAIQFLFTVKLVKSSYQGYR